MGEAFAEDLLEGLPKPPTSGALCREQWRASRLCHSGSNVDGRPLQGARGPGRLARGAWGATLDERIAAKTKSPYALDETV
jgi:hypothetical protein